MPVASRAPGNGRDGSVGSHQPMSVMQSVTRNDFANNPSRVDRGTPPHGPIHSREDARARIDQARHQFEHARGCPVLAVAHPVTLTVENVCYLWQAALLYNHLRYLRKHLDLLWI